jgi:uncharacterized membrane protein YhaH (DUF805 family)
MEYFLSAVKRYAEFTGRATRQEYWMYVLFYIIFAMGVGVIGGLLGTMALSTIYSLGLLIPSISICTRRLHDTGRSGWWQLIALIPLIGWIVLIVFLVQDTKTTDNTY